MYIALEGIDLVGKSTQMVLLKKEFPKFIFTREPGGTLFGKKIREILLHEEYSLHTVSEFLLFLADRSEHYQRIIKPNLESNKTIISDRSIISGMAYALQNGGISENEIKNLNLLSVENRLPDLVVFIEISKEELLKRRGGNIHDKIEMRGVEYSLSVQKNLIYWIEKLGLNLIKVSASESESSIFKKIKEKISHL
jgi:dTMP kinase